MGSVVGGQGGGGAVDLQTAYNASGAPPHIVVDGTNLGLTIRDNATPIGSALFQVQNNAGSQTYFNVAAAQVQTTVPFDVEISSTRVVRAQAGQVDFGRSGRRGYSIQDPDATGYPTMVYMPDGLTRTTLTGGSMLTWSSTVTTNVPGGGGIGNDNAPSAISWIGECIFADQGNLFATQLLVNAAATLTCQANIGPQYLFLDQYLMRADGGSRTGSQHNALRIQPRWGPNISGGSFTQASAVYILNTASVDATVGSCSITALTYWSALNPTLTAGGTIGTFTALDIANISGPTTIRGLNSAMNNGTFIRHTGTAISTFTAASIQFNDNVGIVYGTGSDVLTNWNGTAFEWDPATGDDLRIAFAAGSHTVTTSSGSALAQILFGHPKAAFGQTSAIGNQKFVFAANAETWSGGGTSIDQVLLTQAGNDTVNTVNVSRFSGWAINAPNITIDAANRVTTITGLTIAGSMSVSGATVTNKAGLHITSNPTGGTGINAALWVTAGRSRFDGVVDINNPVALGGGAPATLGTIGGSGPATAAQNEWVQIEVNGNTRWMAVWA